jgi:hypothetical protein
MLSSKPLAPGSPFGRSSNVERTSLTVVLMSAAGAQPLGSQCLDNDNKSGRALVVATFSPIARAKSNKAACTTDRTSRLRGAALE